MAFNDTVMREYASIQGRKIDTGDGPVYVEDLVEKDGVPSVILSNDSVISLMEALNFPIWQAPATTSSEISGGGNHFPQVQYDEHGIPINLANVATSEEDMMEVSNKFSQTGTGKKYSGSPLQNLLQGAKKDEREFTLTFSAKVIGVGLYEVLKESYPDENIDDIMSDMVAADIISNLPDTIKRNIFTILTSKINPANGPKEEENSGDN